ncbi:MAG TPA: 50S ribosomal protein L7/L12 [Patescibacteria group bacterium]|nr:50S ribosomal protein L7/L12 [Patescibacteria group bacterium]
MADIKSIVAEVEKMTLLEVSELVKALEEKFGVSASAPVMMGAMPGAAAAAPAEEKTEFDVIMTSFGDKKLEVIKAVRLIKPELGLGEAKALVEKPSPVEIAKGVKKEVAEDAKAKLTAAGATVELK